MKNANNERAHPRVTINCGISKENPAMTKQSFKDECDIRNILATFGRTGLVNHLASGSPRYEDLSNVTDFKSAMDTVTGAQEYFDKLPSEIRRRFGNDPQQFLEFVDDDKNRDEAIKLGLIPESEAAASEKNLPGDPVDPIETKEVKKEPPKPSAG